MQSVLYCRKSLTQPLIASALLALLGVKSSSAQAPYDVQVAFHRWAGQALHPVLDGNLNTPTADLAPLGKMVGNARIVALSEAAHGGEEPLEFRNRLFKYLATDLGFNAIVIESGFVESRLIDDYVAGGQGDLEAVMKGGLSWGFDRLRPNFELVRWMRQQNARPPARTGKLRFFGFDIPGGPGNPHVLRGPDTALKGALGYLSTVDAQASARFAHRLDAFLPVLKSTVGYATLQQTQRDSLTAGIADLISLLERHRFEYIRRTSKNDYEWAEGAAIGARQMDAFLRLMPVGWKATDGFDWEDEAELVRDQAMADNLERILSQLGPRARVLVFAHVAHVASTPIHYPDAQDAVMVPFGEYARARFGDRFINILNLVVGGEVENCSALVRRPQPLKPPPASSVEALFASLNVPHFVLDLRNAPPEVSIWMHEAQDNWNGDQRTRFAPATAFDIAYYVSPITAACAE